MRRAVAVVLAASVLGAGAGGAAAAAVERGDVVPFHGVAGAELGMTRGKVVLLLGAPLQETAFGVLSYSRTGILDVYLTRPGPRGRVRQVVAVGRGFCLKGAPGACSLRARSLRAVLRAYPHRFRRVVDDTGDTIYWWCGRVGRRAVSTSFNVDPRRGVVLTWYVRDQGTACPTLAQVRRGG